MQRTRDALARADLVVSVSAADARGSDASVSVVAAAAMASVPASVARLQVINKIDLTGESATEATDASGWTIRLSARTGEGIDLLRAGLLRLGGLSESGEGVFLARSRHLVALQAAAEHLRIAAAGRLPADLLAEEIRLAHDSLGRIVGHMTSDDLLGEIFGRFCIGK